MKKNAAIDILLNWKKLTMNQKIQRLQDFEHMISRIQGRKPRKIQTEDKMGEFKNMDSEREASAYYSRNDINNIYFFKLGSDPAIESLKLLVHEGFHAYIDDFVNGRVPTLRLYSKLDKERFMIEEENLPAIAKKFKDKHMLPLFDSFHIEETLNYLEDSIYISKFIVDAIESPYEAKTLLPTFVLSLGLHVDNIDRGKNLELKYKTTYEDVVIEALNEPFDDKVDISKMGKIQDEINPEYLEFYNNISKQQSKIISLIDNKFMMPNAKEKLIQEMADELQNIFMRYIVENLKAKKKF